MSFAALPGGGRISKCTGSICVRGTSSGHRPHLLFAPKEDFRWSVDSSCLEVQDQIVSSAGGECSLDGRYVAERGAGATTCG
jgi:hypothetical protein